MFDQLFINSFFTLLKGFNDQIEKFIGEQNFNYHDPLAQ